MAEKGKEVAKTDKRIMRFNNIYCDCSCQWNKVRCIRADKCIYYNQKLAGSAFTGYDGVNFRVQRCIVEHGINQQEAS